MTTAITEALLILFAQTTFVQAAIALEKDFDGDEVYRITAEFQSHIPAEQLYAARDTFRQKLLAAGDDRFIFIRQVTAADASEPEDDAF